MTEQQRNSKILTYKILSILCILAVLGLNMTSWVSIKIGYGVPSYIREELSEITNRLNSSELMDMIQGEFGGMNLGVDANKLVKDVTSIVEPISDLALSPYEFVRIYMGYKGVMEVLNSPQMAMLGSYYMDSESMMAIQMLESFLFIGTALFVILVLTSVLHIVFHILNKNGTGISIAVFSFLEFVFMGLIWLGAFAVTQETGYGLSANYSISAFGSFVVAIFACVFWSKAKKYINMVSAPTVNPMYNQAAYVQQAYAGYAQPTQPYGQPAGQPYGQPVQPYGQPVQPYGQPVQPYAQPVQPAVTPVEPEVAVVEPEVAVVEPEVTVAEPEVAVVEPEVAVVEPEVTPVEPVATPAVKFCPYCGTKQNVESKFCSSCGAAL